MPGLDQREPLGFGEAQQIGFAVGIAQARPELEVAASGVEQLDREAEDAVIHRRAHGGERRREVAEVDEDVRCHDQVEGSVGAAQILDRVGRLQGVVDGAGSGSFSSIFGARSMPVSRSAIGRSSGPQRPVPQPRSSAFWYRPWPSATSPSTSCKWPR